MIYWRKVKQKPTIGNTRLRHHYCLFPVVTRHAIFWLHDISYSEEYYYDSSTGTSYWKKRKIVYFDKDSKKLTQISID